MRSCRDFLKIYLCKKPVDFRRGMFSLSQMVAAELSQNPLDGSLYVFTNRSNTSLRCLYWHKTGFAMWMKVLEKSKFPWPKDLTSASVELSGTQLDWLIDGVDIWKIKPHPELKYSRII